MIPNFPEFKRLELSDRAEVDAHTAAFPPYSDYDFASIWAWDVKEEMALSRLNGNLVVRFTDYTTGQPFLSFLGTERATETVEELMAYSAKEFGHTDLHLIPEAVAKAIDRDIYAVEESRDHFDYICDVANHIEYPGKELHAHRKLLRQFREQYPEFEGVALDLADSSVQREVINVYTRWDQDRGFITSSEAFAFERFLSAIGELSYTAVGIRIDGTLIALHIASLPEGTCADALFSKAVTSFRGSYAALDHVVALDLLERGYTHMNIQQDLGIEGLRKAKLSLNPAYYLKKFSVRELVLASDT